MIGSAAMSDRRWDTDERGEGVHSIIFGVPDIEDALAHAKELGYPVSAAFGFGGNEPWKHKLEVFKEAVVGEALGTLIGFGEIRYADGVISGQS